MMTTQTKPNRTKRRERFAFRVEKGCLVPADSYTQNHLRERGYKVGDLLFTDLTKVRNPRFNRLVHRIGQLVVANIEVFAGLDAHKAIKRLQLESGAYCDEIAILLDGYGMVIQRIPMSLSFTSCDELEYHEAAKIICRHIASKYWSDLTPDKIEEMASSFVDEA